MMLIGLLGCAAAGAFSFTKTDLMNEKLNGPVRCVKEYKMEKARYFHADTVAKYKRLNMPLPEYIRDLVTSTTYNPDGMISTSVYTLVDSIARTYDSRDRKKLMYLSEIRYDDAGNLRRIYNQTLDESGLPAYGVAIDENGDTIFVETYHKTVLPDGAIQLDNKHVSTTMTSSINTLKLRPNLSLERLTKHTPSRTRDILFDEQERPVKITESSNGVVDLTVDVVYKADGEKYYRTTKDGRRVLTSSVTTDKHGNPIRTDIYDENGSLTKSTSNVYIYDKHNNWIKKTAFTNSDSNGVVTERDIEYYR